MIDSQAQQAVVDNLIIIFTTTLTFSFLKWCYNNNRTHKNKIKVYIMVWSLFILTIATFRAYANKEPENYIISFGVTLIISTGIYFFPTLYKDIKNSFDRGEDLSGWKDIFFSKFVLSFLVGWFSLAFYTNTEGLIVAIICLVLSFILLLFYFGFSRIEREIEHTIIGLKKDINKFLIFLIQMIE